MENKTETIINQKEMFYQSATKLVLLAMTIGLITFTGLGIIDGKDFVMLVSMVFSFYFGQKSLNSK